MLARCTDSADQSASLPIIVLQIGINLGDVIIEGGDIYGDGVNMPRVWSRFKFGSQAGSSLNGRQQKQALPTSICGVQILSGWRGQVAPAALTAAASWKRYELATTLRTAPNSSGLYVRSWTNPARASSLTGAALGKSGVSRVQHRRDGPVL